jgi:gamma-glutamylcyclotransferase (GGCT)/AIG2-like uncharacterized protein YtfP
MKYIAYGSNMSVDQMRYRCPDAKLIGVGQLVGARLEFYMHATVEPSESTADTVPVAVWEISPADEARLDAYEGYPNYYTKETCQVEMLDGSQIEGMIYTMNIIRDAPPTGGYYVGIRSAYVELGLSSEIDRVLKSALERSRSRAKHAQ